MEWQGLKVCHIAMGEGKITRHDGKYVYVQFSGGSDEKIFAYPGCFRGFLRVTETAALDAIEQALQEENDKEEKARFERISRINLLRQEVGKEKSAMRKTSKKTTGK